MIYFFTSPDKKVEYDETALMEKGIYVNALSNEAVLSFLESNEELGLDIETCDAQIVKNNKSVYQPGLDPYLSKICLFQIGNLTNQFLFDTRYVDVSFLYPILKSDKIIKVGMNLQFETKFIRHHFGFYLQKIWDIMIVEKILFNGAVQSYSLEAIANRRLGTKSVEENNLFSVTYDDNGFLEIEEDHEQQYIDKSVRMGFVNIGDKPFTITQLLYANEDIIMPLKIKKLQQQGRELEYNELVTTEILGAQIDEVVKVKENYYPEKGIRLENETVLPLAAMTYNGVPFDSDKWLALLDIAQPIFEKRKRMLDQWVLENAPDKFHTQPDLFSNSVQCKIEWTSPKQVIELFRAFDICPKEKSKQTGKPEWTVGAKELLKKLPSEHKEKYFKNLDIDEVNSLNDFILLYLLYKKSQQLTTTFGKDYLKYVHPITGRIHPNFNQYMNTSRLSSYKPNGQNIPGGDYRKAFFTGNQDLIAVDFSSQEVRALADVTCNETMISFFTNPDEVFDGDFHSFSATMIARNKTGDNTLVYSKATHPKERNISKTITFANAYGASPFSLQFSLETDLENATKFIEDYFNGFPGLKENFEKTKQIALTRGWVQLDAFTDRRYFYPDFHQIAITREKALSLQPENWRFMSKEAKAEWKLQNPDYAENWKNHAIYKGRLERISLNYRIQGLAAGMSKLALCLIHRAGIYLILAVHDEILAIGSKEDANFISQEMIHAGKYFCKRVPMGADPAFGDYWIH